MNKNIVIEIIEILKKTYPDAKCSLNFTTPFEMLIAVMLSAQCTDERVNKTTPYIFNKYNIHLLCSPPGRNGGNCGNKYNRCSTSAKNVSCRSKEPGIEEGMD